MKKILAMLLAGMMVLSLTACGGNGGNQAADDNSNAANNGDSTSSDTTGGEAGGTFKIGGHGPLTGPAAIYGNAAKNGAQIAVDEINAEGGAIQFETGGCSSPSAALPLSPPKQPLPATTTTASLH